ncbi:MAG: PHP domain-containing protein [Clostridia bacterium]|nr:PHP domain-containing protein [Clostridia bacterium]
MEKAPAEKPLFSEVFSLYSPRDAAIRRIFDGARVEKVQIFRAARLLTASVSFAHSPSDGELALLEKGIAEAYQLSAAILVERHGTLLPEDAARAASFLRKKHPSVNGFFNDCVLSEENGRPVFTLSCASLPLPVEEVEDTLAAYFAAAGIDLKRPELRFRAAPEGKDFDERIREQVKKELSSLSSAPSAPEPSPAPERESAGKKKFARAPRPKIMHEGELLYGKPFGDAFVPLSAVTAESEYAAPGVYTSVTGKVFAAERKDFRNGASASFTFDITDKTSSIRCKKLINLEKEGDLPDKIKIGSVLYVRGTVKYDRYVDDIVLDPVSIMAGKEQIRPDDAEEKRVELHVHTQMSQMDAVSSATDLLTRAKYWGHPAMAITDHGVAQAYPEAAKAAKQLDFKVIYGCEGYYVNDLEDVTIVSGKKREPFDGYFVCFDLETTGVNKNEDAITEIAASLVHGDVIVDNFHTYVNPERPIPPFITELTGITNAMVASAPKAEEAVRAFLEFVGDRVVVAHNASFDTGFVAEVCKKAGIPYEPTYIDTVEMSRSLMPEMEHHRLNNVAEALNLPKFKHHTASDDSKTLAMIFIRLKEMAAERLGCRDAGDLDAALNDLRRRAVEEKGGFAKSLPTRHILLLVKNRAGLKNLYKIISAAHLEHMNSRKLPIIPRHVLTKYREGILVGSACNAGELYSAVADGKARGSSGRSRSSTTSWRSSPSATITLW